MTAPRIVSCEGKVAFASAAIALKAAKRRNGRMIYRYEYCGAFHVGSVRGKPPRQRKR